MREFIVNNIPVIMTFVSGGFFWEFARHMFVRKKPVAQTIRVEGADPTSLFTSRALRELLERLEKEQR